MNKKPKGRSRKKTKSSIKAAVLAAGAAAAVAAAAGAGYYIYEGQQYKTVFFPSTRINGIDASYKTVEQMEKLISATVDNYTLTIKEKDGTTEQITGEDIGLHSVFDGKLEEYLAGQDPMEWWKHRSGEEEYEINTMIAFDQDKLDQKIESLKAFNQEDRQAPKDAYLSEYLPGQGYVVIPDEPGNIPDKDKTAEEILTAVKGLKTELDLEELDVYEKAAVTVDDRELHELADRLNRCVNMTVTYTFGENQEVLGGERISQWLSVGEDGGINLSQEGVAGYVKGLADKYNTASKKKVLKTSYGETVEIDRGTYGWRIDQNAETEQLYQILLSGESQIREPVYRQEAASHGENDYGDTYVEINLTAQHLYFYKSGQLVVESDLVSGNAARGNATPSGAYPLSYKQRNATLRGANYATPVSYWMPFNGNIGMHDATWRGSFGGSIYKTNGSHGCINLPKAVAKTIYENIEKGMPVLCYYLDGTESGKSVSSGGGTAAPPPAAVETSAPDAGAGVGIETVQESTDAVCEETDVPEGAGEQESSGEERETERLKMPWEYGPGVTQAETLPESPESPENQGEESPQTGQPDGGEAGQPQENGETPMPSGEGGTESQEAGPGM